MSGYDLRTTLINQYYGRSGYVRQVTIGSLSTILDAIPHVALLLMLTILHHVLKTLTLQSGEYGVMAIPIRKSSIRPQLS